MEKNLYLRNGGLEYMFVFLECCSRQPKVMRVDDWKTLLQGIYILNRTKKQKWTVYAFITMLVLLL